MALGLMRRIRFKHHEDSSHDGMKGAVVGIRAWRQIVHGECAVGAYWSGIKSTSLADRTPIMSDGMESGRGIFPGNRSASSNLD